MGENNSDFNTSNKTSKGLVMCFVIVSINVKNNIYNNYTRHIILLVSSALKRLPSKTLAMTPHDTV